MEFNRKPMSMSDWYTLEMLFNCHEVYDKLSGCYFMVDNSDSSHVLAKRFQSICYQWDWFPDCDSVVDF